MSKPSDADRPKFEDIAIVGMAGRFPGAPSVDAFWANVRDGVRSVRTLSDEQLLAAGVTRAELADPDYVKASPVLDDVDKFDASFLVSARAMHPLWIRRIVFSWKWLGRPSSTPVIRLCRKRVWSAYSQALGRHFI